jgi:RsiW-degrading membrane proteinase PrsW (M82 family)
MDYTLLALAILPGLIISYYIWWRDKHEPEPHKYLIVCFLFGILSILPALIFESIGMEMGYKDGPNVYKTFIFAVFVVGFSEEFSKYLFLRYYIFPKKEFCEPMDGIVYSVMISMGFASFENVLYVFGQETSEQAYNVAYLRMLTAVPAHASFAVIMGYFVGKAKFLPNNRSLYMISGLLLATLVHGLYDFFLMQRMDETLAIFTFITLLAAIILGRYMIYWHVEESPHKH